MQAKVVVSMFSRLVDLQNIDLVLRHLDNRAQQEVVKRLGYLNVINPLKIAFDYVLPLTCLDNRILLVSLMELASVESADNIIEDANTQYILFLKLY